MSQSKILLLVLALTVSLTSVSLSGDHDARRYRYLTPLSTNIGPEDVRDSEDGDLRGGRESIYMKEKEPQESEELNEERWNPEVFAQIFSEAEKIGLQIHNSKDKAREIEREILKQRNEKERELKKLLAEIDREHRKHIVDIEREQKRIMRELEREYKRKMKD